MMSGWMALLSGLVAVPWYCYKAKPVLEPKCLSPSIDLFPIIPAPQHSTPALFMHLKYEGTFNAILAPLIRKDYLQPDISKAFFS